MKIRTYPKKDPGMYKLHFHPPVLILLLVALFCLSACSVLPTQNPEANMVNPASTFCMENGGREETRKDASGGEYGVCVFPDGSECDSWAFFRGECRPGESASAPEPAPGPVYVNETYGFSFNPKVPWAISDQTHLLQFRNQNYILSVGYRWKDEEAASFYPEREGDMLETNPAILLGQSLPKYFIVSEGKVKQVDYGENIGVSDLRLDIWLDYDQSQPIDSAAFEMPPEIIAQADAILASFSLTSGETPTLEFPHE
jgi:putative hemolysin